MLKEIYLVHHTHMDIGYTDLPHEVMNQHLIYMDMALDLCERSANSDNQFFWTCESSLLIKDYLASRPVWQRERLFHALREGWIELEAFLTQPLTELPTGEELIASIGYAAELGKKESFPVECAMLEDIGGYAGRLPSVLSGWGVRYLVAAVGGYQVHLPWANMPHLFYLEDKSGARVLFWNLGIDRRKKPQDMGKILDAVYGMGANYLVRPYYKELMKKKTRGVELDISEISASASTARAYFAEFERRLKEENYPFAEVMLQYGGDNRGPDPNLSELISRMNAIGNLPHIRLTTPRYFLRHMEEKYGAKIPVIRGIITDPWNMRVNPTPVGFKIFRQAQRILSTAEMYQTMLSDGHDENELTQETYQNLHLYADHTCGLSEWNWQKLFNPESGCRDVVYDRYRCSWAIKKSYAISALQQAERLARKVRQQLSAEIYRNKPSILVWNSSAQPISGPVEIYLGRDYSDPMIELSDAESGSLLEFQCIGNNRYLIFSPIIPAMGFRRLEPIFGKESLTPSYISPLDTNEIENDFLKVRLDNTSGRIFSIVDKRNELECLDCEKDMGFADFVYHRIYNPFYEAEQSGMNKLKIESISVDIDRVYRGTCGPIVQTVINEGHVRGLSPVVRFHREIRLYNHLPRIDVRFRLDKPETEQKESCYIAFPFVGKDGVFRFDQNLGWVEPSLDIIPGAMQDAFYCYSWVNISTEGRGITVISPDAPIFQFGRIKTGSWDDIFPFIPGRNHLYSWLYHNLLNTDTPIWQDVLDDFNFSAVFHNHGFLPEEVMLASAQVTQPLYAEFCSANRSGTIKEPVLGFLKVTPGSVRLISARQIGPKTVLTRLEETTGKSVQTRISSRFPVTEAWIEDFFGNCLNRVGLMGKQTLEFELKPNAIVTLRIRYT